MKVGLFIPCYINAVYPNVGVASYKLLKSLGVDVDYPLDQTCCGQPMANAGFEDEAEKLAFDFEERFKETKERDEHDRARYKRIYGIDNDEYDKIADLVIDTDSRRPEEIADLIIREAEKKRG